MKKRLVFPLATAAFLLFLFAFLSARLTPGVKAEGTDWAMYVMHARNIAGGLPYTQTGYVFQPESTTEVGANSYPSGFPLLLAPFYALFGLDYRLFKLLNTGFLVLSLWPVWLLARRTLPSANSFLLVVSLAFSTLFLSVADGIGSDAPYQLVSLSVLALLLWIHSRRADETGPWRWGLIAGACIAAAYLIRPMGLALILAVAGTELFRRRRITAYLIAAAAAFLPPLLLNNLLLHKDSSYAYQFTLSVPQIAAHAVAYLGYFSYAFANPLSHLLRYSLWAVTLPLVLLAIVKRVRSGAALTELYFVVVLAVDSVYWVPNPRYLLGIMPIYMIYMFEGFRILLARIPGRLQRVLQVAAIALLLLAPAANAVLLRPDANDTLVTAPAWEELCAEVRRQPASNTPTIFWNPRVFALATGRPASGWPAEGPPERMSLYLRRLRPVYIVVDRSRADDRRFLVPVLAEAPPRFTEVYRNERFSLMRTTGETPR